MTFKKPYSQILADYVRATPRPNDPSEPSRREEMSEWLHAELLGREPRDCDSDLFPAAFADGFNRDELFEVMLDEANDVWAEQDDMGRWWWKLGRWHDERPRLKRREWT